MNLLTLIPLYQKRTLKLLHETRLKYDIDMFLTMRKMLAASIIITYLQDIEDFQYYISYQAFLERNEELVREYANKNAIYLFNGISKGQFFFGIPSEEFHEATLGEIITLVKEKIIQKILKHKEKEWSL